MIQSEFLNRYQSSANTVAIYPGRLGERLEITTSGLFYVVLGLSGEIGELQEKIICQEHEDLIIKEFGDVYWYISQVCMELDTPMSHLLRVKVNFKKLRKIQDASYMIERQLLSLSILSGRINEILKKSFRDNNGHITPAKKEEIIEILSKIIHSLSGVAGMCNIDPEEAMHKNIEKLFSRKERGVLGGSGDNR